MPGTVAWYLTDHLGSVTGLLNNSNTLIDGLVYDAFGNVTYETNASNGDRYAFTGRERDLETGLQYNRARWYNAATNLAGNLCSDLNSVGAGSPGK